MPGDAFGHRCICTAAKSCKGDPMVQERMHPIMPLIGGSHRGSNAAQADRLVGGAACGCRCAWQSVQLPSCEELQGRGSMAQERRHPIMTTSGGSHRGSNAARADRLVGGVSGGNVRPAVPTTHGLKEEIAWRKRHRGSPMVIPKELVAQN
ncbi:hypothetical protein N9L68_01275 [bacterium]|nr:hypothetical protein [bacterium]